MNKMMRNNLLAYKGIKLTLGIVIILTLLEATAIIFQAKWLGEWLYRLFNGQLVSQTWEIGILFLVAFLTRYLVVMIKEKSHLSICRKNTCSQKKAINGQAI
ncbi:MAG: hypothetical protein ACFWT6_02220 [Virgibacillus proomii]